MLRAQLAQSPKGAPRRAAAGADAGRAADQTEAVDAVAVASADTAAQAAHQADRLRRPLRTR